MRIQAAEDTMEEGTSWSCIPDLILWMIMERLQFIDNLHLSAVCKHWLCAFRSCPKENLQTVNGSFPWLMITKDYRGSEREFFNPWTKTKITIDIPEFANTMVVCSKKGWLLLATCKFPVTRFKYAPHPVSPLFLINPFTKVRLEIPPIHEIPPINHFSPAAAAISMLDDGSPNCVVLSNCLLGASNRIILAIAHPSDDAWKFYTYTLEDLYNGMRHMFLIDRYLYIIDTYGRVLGFDMNDFVWMGFMGEKNEETWSNAEGIYYVECNREIIKVSSNCWFRDEISKQKTSLRFVFYRFSFTKAAWELLSEDEDDDDNDNDIQGKTWFLSRNSPRFSSVANQTAVKKVNFLYKFRQGENYFLDCYNLNSLDKDVQSYFGNLGKEKAIWVNMGD